MMMSDLPADLVEEILSKVPATSLNRLRSTSKRWNTLFKNRRFTKKHFLKAPKQSLVLLSKPYKVTSMNVNPKVAVPIEFKGALSIKDSNSRPVDIGRVFHCDGLLLCTTLDNRLVVCNPCLGVGENKWVPFRTDDKRYNTKFSLGYQNNQSCRNFKILRWRNYYKPNHHVVGFDIYDFSSGSWRVLNNVSLDCIMRNKTGVSLKGNTYWLTRDNFLSSFDFTLESFKRFSLPPIPNSSHHKALSVVREEQLSVLYQICPSTLEIWMSNTISTQADLLWSKSFKVDLKIPSLYSSPICTSYVVLEEKKVAVCCIVDGELRSHNKIRRKIVQLVTIAGEDVEHCIEIPYEVVTIFKMPFILVSNYVPSLVQINQGRG